MIFVRQILSYRTPDITLDLFFYGCFSFVSESCISPYRDNTIPHFEQFNMYIKTKFTSKWKAMSNALTNVQQMNNKLINI